VDVAARFANEADGGGVGPIQIEKREGGRIELSLAPVEFVVPTNLALEKMTVDLVRFGFGFCK
jgi:hypothetical protein